VLGYAAVVGLAGAAVRALARRVRRDRDVVDGLGDRHDRLTADRDAGGTDARPAAHDLDVDVPRRAAEVAVDVHPAALDLDAATAGPDHRVDVVGHREDLGDAARRLPVVAGDLAVVLGERGDLPDGVGAVLDHRGAPGDVGRCGHHAGHGLRTPRQFSSM
jgi:hypothetical protein